MPEQPVAIVTGAAGGLGRVISKVLTEDGFRVALVDMAAEPLEALAAELPGSAAFVADITDEPSVADLIARIDAHYGRIDALVNNAGVEPAHTYRDMDTELFDRTILVNLRAPALLVKHVVPVFDRQQSGSIVFTGSRSWASGSAEPGYVASKAGVIGLARSAARELGPIGVNANVVAPSFVRTPLNAAKGDPAAQEAYAVHFASVSPLQRLIQPVDVANTIAFLVSERARNISGEVVHVSAGSQLAPA